MARVLVAGLAVGAGAGALPAGAAPAPSPPAAALLRHIGTLSGIRDLVGVRTDGLLEALTGDQLLLVDREGHGYPFVPELGARGAGSHAAIALAPPDPAPRTPCGFSPNQLLLTVASPAGAHVTTIDAQGAQRPFAVLDDKGALASAAVDDTGRFGGTLLVLTVAGGSGRLLALDCAGHTAVVGHALREVAGALTVAAATGPGGGAALLATADDILEATPDGAVTALGVSGLTAALGGGVPVGLSTVPTGFAGGGGSIYLADAGGLLRLGPLASGPAGVADGDVLISGGPRAALVDVHCAPACIAHRLAWDERALPAVGRPVAVPAHPGARGHLPTDRPLTTGLRRVGSADASVSMLVTGRSDGLAVSVQADGLRLVDRAGATYPYVAAIGGHVRGLAVTRAARGLMVGCDFPTDNVLAAVESAGATAILAYGPSGVAQTLTAIADATAQAAAVDGVGRFGGRLLLLDQRDSGLSLDAVDCRGLTDAVSGMLPALYPALTVAPANFRVAPGAALLAGPAGLLDVRPDGVATSIPVSGWSTALSGSAVTGISPVPPGFRPGGAVLVADDRGLLRLPSDDPAAAAIKEGDLLLAGGAPPILVDVHCDPGCRATRVAVGPDAVAAHGAPALIVSSTPREALLPQDPYVAGWPTLLILSGALLVVIVPAVRVVAVRRRSGSARPDP